MVQLSNSARNQAKLPLVLSSSFCISSNCHNQDLLEFSTLPRLLTMSPTLNNWKVASISLLDSFSAANSAAEHGGFVWSSGIPHRHCSVRSSQACWVWGI